MFRKCLLAAYGVVVGVAFAAVIQNAAGITSPVAVAAWVIALAIMFGLFGWSVAGSPDWPGNWRILILIPLAPFAFLGSLLAITVFVVPIAAALWPFFRAKQIMRERSRRNALAAQGRFATIDTLRPKLDAGTGSLIVDTGEKEPYRVWWTEDDLFDLGKPVSTKDEFIAAFRGEHAFNARCLTEYLDDKTGKALLTSMTTRDWHGEQLTRTFPQMRVAAVIRTFPVAGSP